MYAGFDGTAWVNDPVAFGAQGYFKVVAWAGGHVAFAVEGQGYLALKMEGHALAWGEGLDTADERGGEGA